MTRQELEDNMSIGDTVKITTKSGEFTGRVEKKNRNAIIRFFGAASNWIESFWWIFYLVFFALLLLWWYFVKNPMPEFEILSIVESVLFVVYLILFIPIVVLIIKKKWLKFAISVLGVFIATGIWALLGFLSFFEYGSSDHFGERHPIPEGMAYFMPDENLSEPALMEDEQTWIFLSQGIQPGIYEYSISVPKVSDGTLSLKGFEAVTDFPLSIRRATIPVQGHDDFGNVGTGEFTLYTGIWDEPYAVRLELWHEDSESKSEKKLTEKIYKLEGWMR